MAGNVCAYPWQQMNIDLTGEVVPCCFWSGYGNDGKPLGNTNEQTLDEIWNGEAYRELRRANATGDLSEGHPCHECLAWQWSGGRYPDFEWPAAATPETGLCFTVAVPAAIREALDADEGASAQLLEDGQPLPHPDAVHDEIREQGAGRYSLWGETLYFSTVDGSDPRTNGRAYALVCGDLRVELPGLRTGCASGENLVQAHEEYERGETTMTAKPSMLSFISTADCNIDCPACSQNTVRITKVQHRAETEADVLAHVPYLHQFIWHGGEPYLIRGFRAFIDGFRTEHNPNLQFGFTSNGTLLDADELEKLARFPRVNASVSMDSFVPSTFEAIRAGARFSTVRDNVLRAVERYEPDRFVIHVGMIITKDNVAELPANLEFALEHGLGVNLSPVVVYPVIERIDVFRDFHAQAGGWLEAIDEAARVIERARERGAVALRRIDPAGHVQSLRRIVSEAAARHARVFPLTVRVSDPHGGLANMRRPGLIVTGPAGLAHPLGYVEFDRGADDYQVLLPKDELMQPGVGWCVVHDLYEPMGIVDQDRFRSAKRTFVGDDGIETSEQLSIEERGYAEMPALLRLEMPAFEALWRPRNVRVANFGQSTPDGLHVLDPSDIFAAYKARSNAEAAEGKGLVGAGPDIDREVVRRAGEYSVTRYADFVSLLD